MVESRNAAMSDKAICPGCGAALAPNMPAGLCPHCALKDALDLGDEQPPATSVAITRSRAGRRLGDYELLKQIGRGGMGVVYQAHQFSLNRDVALKLILDANQSSPRAIGRFQLEAEAAARLHHPNIVPIYEIAEMEEQHFLTMKLIEGGSLARRMSGGEFRVAAGGQTSESVHQMQIRIARLVIAIARAVHYAHERGVLHRDIKPGNILIDDTGDPYLTDFGLAKLTDAGRPLSHSGVVKGTPAYMAPEQARGEVVTQAADIYSLGVVLYEMLMGRPPFSGATPLETLRLITEQEPAHPTTTSEGVVDLDLATICLKCMEKNPAARYGTARDLADDLERWLKHEPIRARPVSPAARLQRWVRRNPVGTTLIAVLVLGIATTSLLVFRLRNEQSLVKQERDKAEEQNVAIRESVFANIERLWTSENRSFEMIPAEQLAVILGRPKARLDYNREPLRLTVGTSVGESPINTAERYASMLVTLEAKVSDIMGQPVYFDLKAFKFNSVDPEEIVRGALAIRRMGTLPYIHLKAQYPGLVALARDEAEKDCVIFVRKGLGIASLSQMRGRSFAFGDESSTITFWAKFHLARAGIFGTNLTRWEHLDSKQGYVTRVQQLGLKRAASRVLHSHSEVIQAVRQGEYDAGVAREGYVQDFVHRDFDIIHRFNSTPNVWVVGRGLDTNVLYALQRAMFDGGTLLLRGGMSRTVSTRFVPVDDSYFESMRQALTNEVAHFEGDRSVQSIGGGDDE